MNYKNILILAITFSGIFISCKKDTKTTPVIANTGNNSFAIDAEIYVFKEIYVGTVVNSFDYHLAMFYGSALTNSSVPSVNAGTVSVNGITFKMDNSNSSGPMYSDSTYALPGNTYQINVSGSSQFPAGTLQYGQNFPIFNDTALIPSSIQLSSGISLQFNNCITTDSVVVHLEDNSGNLFSKKYAISNNQLNVSISPSELSGLTPTPNGRISFDMVNMNMTAVGTKNYFVILEKRYNKLNVHFN